MAIDREILSIVQFLRLIDRVEIGQSQVFTHNFLSFFFSRNRTLNNMAAGMKVTGLNWWQGEITPISHGHHLISGAHEYFKFPGCDQLSIGMRGL